MLHCSEMGTESQPDNKNYYCPLDMMSSGTLKRTGWMWTTVNSFGRQDSPILK